MSSGDSDGVKLEEKDLESGLMALIEYLIMVEAALLYFKIYLFAFFKYIVLLLFKFCIIILLLRQVQKKFFLGDLIL